MESIKAEKQVAYFGLCMLKIRGSNVSINLKFLLCNRGRSSKDVVI